jgi:hypothetical protein
VQRGGLLGDDAPVHRLGEGDELHLAVERGEREPVLGRRLDDHGRHVAVVHPQFEHQTRDPDVDELGDERAQGIGLGRPTRARREQQLAAVQEACDSGTVGDVRPPHARVERGVAHEHLGHPGSHGVDGEDLADGGEGVGRGQVDRAIPGAHRTIRLICLDFATLWHPLAASRSVRLGN